MKQKILLFTLIITTCLTTNAQLVISSPTLFSTLDNSINDADATLGVFKYAGNLTISGTGSITNNDVPGPNAGPITIVVTGNFEIKSGGSILAENQVGAGNGGDISITVGGMFTMRGQSGVIPGAKISSSRLNTTLNPDPAGNITIHVGGDILMEFGSVITAFSYKGTAGTIFMSSDNDANINGSVLSQSSGTGAGCNPGHGGFITINAKNNLLIGDKGYVSSYSFDPGADLVHLSACKVKIYGLVESTGVGHGIPTCPVTHLVPTYRPDKDPNSTAGVEVWAADSLVIDNLNHHGEIKADLCCAGGTTGKSWIDLFASGYINIMGGNTGNFAVHANGAAGNTDDGGTITIKSTTNKISASGLAVQANGTAYGGVITIEALKDINLNTATITATGDYDKNGGFGNGGKISVRSFTGNISWTNGVGDVRPTGTNASLAAAKRGTITFQKCVAGVVDVTLTSFPNNGLPATTPVTLSDACGDSPALQLYVQLPPPCTTPNDPCPCIDCSRKIVVVDENTTINFNTAVPTFTGDADLLPYFSYLKPGLTPDTWIAIFNMGPDKLLVKNGATITVSTVNGYAPGISIYSSCDLEIEDGGHIVTQASNKNVGNIVIDINGTITVNGEVRVEATGTLGLPGYITLRSKCGNINIGSTGRVFDLGIDPGGNTISLLTCGSGCLPGDILVSGLVKSYAHAHTGDLTLHRPNIKVVAANGSVTINANTVEPLYDEYSINGGKYDLWGGLLSWVRDNVNPGKVEVQAKKDITVNGHGDDPTAPVRKSFGAIAAVATASNAPGGLIDVRSLEGNISGNDRAFDVSGRNRLVINFAHINLEAKGNIVLNRPGGNNSFNPVVDASGQGSGDRGGRNDLRSYTAGITVGTNAMISAAVPTGTSSVQGSNNLTWCTALVNNGIITPAPVTATSCLVAAPAPIYTDACLYASRPSSFITTGPEPTVPVEVAPNPFTQVTTITYQLTTPGPVRLSIINMQGREVTTLVDSYQAAGEYHVQWNSGNQLGGMYFVNINAGQKTGRTKLVLIK